MKFILFSNNFFFLIFFLLSTNLSASIESDLKKITSKLRCMTCQNQTIYDSDADFSKDIKKIIIEKLQNNEKEEEIIKFLIDRYGEYIVFKRIFNDLINVKYSQKLIKNLVISIG